MASTKGVLFTYQLHWKVSVVKSTMNVNLRENLDTTLTHLMAGNHNDGDDDYYDNHQGKDTNHNQSNMPSH